MSPVEKRLGPQTEQTTRVSVVENVARYALKHVWWGAGLSIGIAIADQFASYDRRVHLTTLLLPPLLSATTGAVLGAIKALNGHRD